MNSTALSVAENGGISGTVAGFDALLDRARDYAAAETAEATRKAYQSDWRDFERFALEHDLEALPASPATAAAYLAALADRGLKASTVARRAAAIAFVHRLAGHDSPTAAAEGVRRVMRGIRRKLGTAPKQKSPATAAIVKKFLSSIKGERPLDVRDRALLLIGFAAALRRSELVALMREDLEISAAGVVVRIRRSKTDQEGEGAEVAIPRGSKLKPVEALEAWLDHLNLQGRNRPTDRVFDLSPQSVALIVKRRARAAKIDPSEFAGHSLRSGFVTSALDAGADVLRVMDVTRHREVKTLKVYDRRRRAFQDHAGRKFL